jgi:DNA repair protein RecO (recombination protein O)
MLTKDKGICIRTTDYSENSQILTFFTCQTGKISAIAKGTKKPKSSFGGPIELCSFGDMVFALKDDDKLATLTEFNPTFFGTKTRKKLLALNCSLFVADLLNLFTKEHDPHPSVFNEAVSFLQKLEESSNDKVLSLLIPFEFSILSETGSMPVCDACSNCRRKFGSDWKDFYFSSLANGLLCKDCEGAFIDRKQITHACAQYLNKSVNAASDYQTLVSTQNLLIDYITHILERPPRTAIMILKLINKTHREAAG